MTLLDVRGTRTVFPQSRVPPQGTRPGLLGASIGCLVILTAISMDVALRRMRRSEKEARDM